MGKAKSGLTQEELLSWGGREVFSQAFALCQSGCVLEAVYDDDTLTVSGRIAQSADWAMPVRFKLEPGGRIRSECPCITNQRYGQVCSHVVALGIAVMFAEMDEPENPSEENSPDEKEFIEVPMQPGFSAYISGSRRSLSIEIDAYYGDIDFPACSLQSERTVYLRDPGDDLVRLVRSPDAEKKAVEFIRKWGFEPGYREGDMKFYLTDPQKVLTFLGSGIPSLRRKKWKLDFRKELDELIDSLPSIVPVVTVKDAPCGAFDVKCTFEARGTEIPPAEIQAAVNRGDGCILKDGIPFLLDTAAVEAMHAVFRDCATSQNGAAAGWFRVRPVYAPYVKASLDALDCVALEDELAERWRRTAAERNHGGSDAKFEPVVLGKLENILRPYQKQGVYWMRFLENAGLDGLLADEMGLGKTLQTLAWLSLPRDSRCPGPALIVCPTSLVRNWEAEAAKFTPWLKTLVVSGPDRAKEFSNIPGADLVITSYALLQRDLEEAYLGTEFSALVIDEAQHIKNRQTKNARAVKAVNARRRLALTGTPIENSVADAWSVFDFLMPGYLGDYESFRSAFEEPIQERADGEALERLKRKLHPFILRRVKKTVAKDLPDKIVKVSYCPMNEEAQREYSAALAKTRSDAFGAIRAKGFTRSKFEILAMLTKLRRIASKSKTEAFMEQLESAIEGGHKILVFSQFTSMLAELKEKLDAAGIRYSYLDGSTKDRLGECRRFNLTPEIPVFLISLMAGGTGLNLTGADMVMHYDPWWNPAVEDQATDRAHRIGQKKTVYVMKMIASGSIEEKVLALQRRKQAIISATVDTTDAAVMESLSAKDLEELLS